LLLIIDIKTVVWVEAHQLLPASKLHGSCAILIFKGGHLQTSGATLRKVQNSHLRALRRPIVHDVSLGEGCLTKEVERWKSFFEV